MFKKFEIPGNQNVCNKKTCKVIKSKLLDQSPKEEQLIEQLIPKKCDMMVAKLKGGDYKIELFAVEGEILFFQIEKHEHIIPTLRTLHKYPQLLPKMQIDKGGIKFIYNGANVMCPGLTSAGGKMEDVEEDTVVGIYCEGKEHAIGIGIMKMSAAEIKKVNKGHGIETYTHLDDGLWQLKEMKANQKKK